MLIYGGWCKPYHARPGLCNTQNGRHGRDGLGPLIVSYEHPENRNRQRRGRGGRRRSCSRGASSSLHSGANICMCRLQYNRPPMTNPVTYGSSLSARSAFPLLTDFLALQSRKNAPHGFVSQPRTGAACFFVHSKELLPTLACELLVGLPVARRSGVSVRAVRG